jgi:hypothetical protein
MLGVMQRSAPLVRVPSDRRGTDRFPIEREVRYKILSSKGSAEVGVGKTINISSTGVLFLAENPLSPGKRIELAISWPAQLDGKCNLKLVARGRVLRSKGNLIAIEIEKYEFRTQGSRGFSTTPGA